MSSKHPPISYKGRSLGILTLTVAQLLIGTIHLLIGLGLLAVEILNKQGSLAYDVYTVAFGSLILFFRKLHLARKKSRLGWNLRGSSVCDLGGFVDCFRFTEYPRYSIFCCTNRDSLQRNRYYLLVAASC